MITINKVNKKIINVMVSLLVLMSMFLNFSVTALAGENTTTPKGYVTFSMEKFTLGLGYVIEPIKVPFYEGDNIAKLTTDLIGKGNYENTGSVESGFYLSSVKDNDTREANVPQYILDESGSIDGRGTEGWLGEFDYTSMAGWMYTVNNKFPNVGCSEIMPTDGDVIRWQFTVYGYGMDLGGGFAGDASSGSFEGSYIKMANKDTLTKKLGEINTSQDKATILAKNGAQEAYDKAYEVIQVAESSQEEVDLSLNNLNKATNESSKNLDLVQFNPSLKDAINETAALMYESTPDPAIGTGAGEWTILSLARAGYSVPQSYYDKYYANVERELAEKKGVLSTAKYTEYSRLILGLTSIGRDVTNVSGYNLLEKLADFNSVKKQGINGPIFALIALDTNKYEIPVVPGIAVQTTRDMLIDYILQKEITTNDGKLGGWALSGKVPDPDITAMAIQALAPYKDDERVKPYIDRGVQALADIQKDNGGYSSWGSINSESIAQVIVALTALGIDPTKDTRFIKGEGNWILSAIMEFYVEGGGFKHILSGNRDGMATDQGMYALVAYDRFVDGKKSLYDMTDEEITENSDGKVLLSIPDRINGNKGTEFKINVKIGSFPEGSYKLLDGIINIPESIEIKNVEMSKTITGGLPDFGVEGDKLRLVYTNTDLTNIQFNGTEFPDDIMTITAVLKEDLPKDTELPISIDAFTLKASSESASTVSFDTSKAVEKIIIGEQVTASGRILYDGDGIDIIPSNKSAIAVEFSNLTGTPSIKLNDNIEMSYSAEISNKTGKVTYVALVNKTVALDGLNDINKYTIDNKKSKEIKFGDANLDSTVNAQDTLNTLSAWLRKGGTPSDEGILSMNVTGDSRVDTYDVLGIMENYINGSEFRVISK